MTVPQTPVVRPPAVSAEMSILVDIGFAWT
jgi:hypothetical protein